MDTAYKYILSSVLLDTIENTLTVVVVMNVSAINKSLSSYTQCHGSTITTSKLER